MSAEAATGVSIRRSWRFSAVTVTSAMVVAFWAAAPDEGAAVWARTAPAAVKAMADALHIRIRSDFIVSPSLGAVGFPLARLVARLGKICHI